MELKELIENERMEKCFSNIGIDFSQIEKIKEKTINDITIVLKDNDNYLYSIFYYLYKANLTFKIIYENNKIYIKKPPIEKKYLNEFLIKCFGYPKKEGYLFKNYCQNFYQDLFYLNNKLKQYATIELLKEIEKF